MIRPDSLALPAAAVLVLALASTAAFAESPTDPLSRLVRPAVGASACFSRTYDAAHSQAHPAQATRSILLSYRYDAEPNGPNPVERLRIDERGERTLLIVASCEWREDAGVDTSGNRILPAFKGGAAYDCLVITQPGSAEEGGYLLIDAAADGESLTLYLDSPIATERGRDGTGAFATVDLGADDRIFRLTRTNPAACHGLEENLEGP